MDTKQTRSHSRSGACRDLREAPCSLRNSLPGSFNCRVAFNQIRIAAASLTSDIGGVTHRYRASVRVEFYGGR